MLLAAKAILFAVALYFIALGVVALLRPTRAERFLLGFVSSPVKQTPQR